jgi:glycosyltransferase involved in cell wall biosynthesis
MMWNKNEGDILADTIKSALQHVDTLVIADDGSTDNSWNVIQSFAAKRHEIEHIQRNPNKADPAQRQQLLNVIRDRYKPEDTWVQIIESDIMILDTDVKTAIKERAVGDVYVNWAVLNAVIPPDKDWDEFDEYPRWSKPIQDILTHGHWMEEMTYTFRPHDELYYDTGPWRPWPKGFSQFSSHTKPMGDYTPLLAHYGYRGPTHTHVKYGKKKVRKYPSWDFTTPARAKATMYFFNGVWNSEAHPMSRHGYKNRKG